MKHSQAIVVKALTAQAAECELSAEELEKKIA